jgi:hypothetical protein
MFISDQLRAPWHCKTLANHGKKCAGIQGISYVFCQVQYIHPESGPNIDKTSLVKSACHALQRHFLLKSLQNVLIFVLPVQSQLS